MGTPAKTMPQQRRRYRQQQEELCTVLHASLPTAYLEANTRHARTGAPLRRRSPRSCGWRHTTPTQTQDSRRRPMGGR